MYVYLWLGLRLGLLGAIIASCIVSCLSIKPRDSCACFLPWPRSSQLRHGHPHPFFGIRKELASHDVVPTKGEEDARNRPSRGTRQNKSKKIWSHGRKKAHLEELETSCASQATKRSHEATHTAPGDVQKAIRTSASIDLVDMEGQESNRASRPNRKASRAKRSAKAMQTTSKTMGNDAERLVQLAASAAT